MAAIPSRLSGTVEELCLALVATPSEYGHEELLADLVEARCGELGVRHERIGHSIVARTGAAGSAIALVGHLDTVPNWPGGETARDGDRIVGRGASDMKGGVAVMLALLQRFAASERPLVFVFYEREEGPNHLNGIHRVLAESTLLGTPAFAIVPEPTDGVVHAGAVGTMNATVAWRGRAAHSARPWQGENAVTNAADALARFRDRAPEPVVVEGLTFYDVVTITTAHGGVASNVVPDLFECNVNVRVAPGRSLDGARAEVARLAGPEAEISWRDESPPALPSVEHPAVRAFLAHTGLEVQPKQAWTDVATLQAAGIAALNYGPGTTAQAHQPGEWVSIELLREAERVLADYLEDGPSA